MCECAHTVQPCTCACAHVPLVYLGVVEQPSSSLSFRCCLRWITPTLQSISLLPHFPVCVRECVHPVCACTHSPVPPGNTYSHTHTRTQATPLSVSAESPRSLKTPKKTCLYFSPQVLILGWIEMSPMAPELPGTLSTHPHTQACVFYL